MTPIIGLRKLLLNQANVTAITSHIQAIPAPEDLTQYPLITFQQISTNRKYALSSPVAIDESRIAYNCFSKDYGQARQLAEAVAQAFDGFHGLLPDGTDAYTQIITMDDGYDTGNQLSKVSVQIYVYA